MKTALFLLVACAAWSQPLRVYSEFAQIDTTGKVTAPAEPREILSPAIVRNGYSSFQIVVDVPRATPFQLYVAQNPENAAEVTLYKEAGDRLELVKQPVSGSGTQVFWMDLWTARDAPVQRIKVEPQLYVNNDWVIYPIEARVMTATVEGSRRSGGTEMEAMALMRQFLCDPGLPTDSGVAQGLTVRSLRSRNGFQDLTLTRSVPKATLQELFGSCTSFPKDPEWYLRIRDYLLRLR